MCPEEMVELSGLVELPVVDLSGADCIDFCGEFNTDVSHA